jgi:hypothetical protein
VLLAVSDVVEGAGCMIDLWTLYCFSFFAVWRYGQRGAALLSFLFFVGHSILKMCTITDAALEPTKTGTLSCPDDSPSDMMNMYQPVKMRK